MNLVSFQALCPELAEAEVRCFRLVGVPDLPDDQYALTEFYCPGADCDCRLVMLNVVRRNGPREFLASIGFGFDRDGPDAGPYLDPLNPQGPHAPVLLRLVSEMLERDTDYVALLESHYRAAKRPPDVRRRLLDFLGLAEEERDPVEFVRRIAAASPRAGAELARLAAYDPDPRLSEAALSILFTGCRSDALDESRKQRFKSAAGPALRSAFRDAGVPDERRIDLGPMAEACGHPVPSAEYKAHFTEFEKAAAAQAKKLRDVPVSIESVERMMVELELLGFDRQPRITPKKLRSAFGISAFTISENPRFGTRVLTATAAIAAEHGKVAGDACAVLRIAAEQRDPATAWLLEELGRWPAVGEIGACAASLASELRAAGVTPVCPSEQRFSHGFVTGIDGDGSRNLLLLYRTGEGTLDGLALLLNDSIGVKDVWCVFGDGAGLERDWTAQHDVRIRRAPCEEEPARALVGDALAIYDRRGVAPPGRLLIYRPLLGAAPIPPRSRTPNLGAYALDTIVRNPEMAADSGALMDDPVYAQYQSVKGRVDRPVARLSPSFAEWPTVSRRLGTCSSCENRSASLTDWYWVYAGLFFASARAYRALARKGSTLRRPEAFAKAIPPLERGLLRARLAANLEVEALAGRARDRLNRICARAWLAIDEGVVPFERVPYVLELARRSIQTISINLEAGFRSQREANAAALEI